MKSNNLIIGALVLTLVIMGVAYAAFSTTLNINGTASIDSEWGPIYLSSCTCSSYNAVDSAHPSSATCTPVTGTSNTIVATIDATMVTPGDVVGCSFGVKNDGTLIAASPTITITPENNDYFTVTKPTVGCIQPGQAQGVGFSIIYKSDVTSAPTSSQSFVIKMDYRQGTSTSC